MSETIVKYNDKLYSSCIFSAVWKQQKYELINDINRKIYA